MLWLANGWDIGDLLDNAKRCEQKAQNYGHISVNLRDGISNLENFQRKGPHSPKTGRSQNNASPSEIR
jgi:hypothetical protein